MSETLANVFSRKKANPTENTHNASLYEKLGGAPAVNAAVDVFYRKCMRDARINYFFFGVNISEQAEKQKAFLTMAFGGPHQYTGRDMNRSHAKLVKMGMKDKHFDIVLDHLRATLSELDVAEPLIIEVINIAESTREDVMGRSHRAIPPAAGTSGQAIGSSGPLGASRPAPSPIDQNSPVSRLIQGRSSATINADTPLYEAAEILTRSQLHELPVIDDNNQFVGMVSANELLRYFLKT
jgi:hemoglobin